MTIRARARLAASAITVLAAVGLGPGSPAGAELRQVDGRPVSLATAYGDTITVVGRGNGHGDGMSQYGAYGYATQFGWDWHQILAHYYGGTTEDSIDPSTSFTVKLRALDDAPFTALVSAKGRLITNQQGAVPTTYKSVVAVETGTDGVYKVYGNVGAAQCPTGATPTDLDPAAGWVVIKDAVGSSSVGTSSKLDVSAAGVVPDTATLADLVGVCQPADASVKLYRGLIRVVNGTSGENRTVNVLPIDQYVRGVIPRESPASWGTGKGVNALASQAVAARTYALAESRYTYAKTCDTDACQVYGAAARQAGPADAVTALEDPRTDAAVVTTSGVILRNAAGGLAFTQFNSSSGGFTSGANFPAVEDLGDAISSNPYNRWTATLQRADLEARYPQLGALQSIEVIKRNGLGEWGGRALKVAVRGTKATVEVTGEQFRSASGLRSAWFSLPTGCEGPDPVTVTAAVPASTYHALAPTRIVDTRLGLGASAAPLAATCVLPIRIASLTDLPPAAGAVSLGVTVVGPTVGGYLTVYPCRSGRPVASNVNYRAGQTVANQVVVALDASDEVCVYSSQPTHVVVDVLGWFGGGDGSQLEPLPPARLLDTRTDVGGHRGVVPSTGVVTIDVFGTGGVPAGAKPSAVVLNLTSTGAAGDGFFVAYACDQPRPATSNLNTGAGRDVAAHAIVAVSGDGHVCLYSNVASHAVVDVDGWYRPAVAPANGAAPAGRFTPVAPVRLLDTRSTGAALAGSSSVAVDPVVAGKLGTAKPRTVVLNATATDAVGAGFLTVYPCGGDVPLASALNYGARTDVANLVTVPVGADGTVCIYSNQTTHVVVDLAAWFT